jgi:hypothetical protein
MRSFVVECGIKLDPNGACIAANTGSIDTAAASRCGGAAAIHALFLRLRFGDSNSAIGSGIENRQWANVAFPEEVVTTTVH